MAALDSPASLVVRGRESAAKLQALILAAPPMEQQGRIGEVAAEILRCFDRALSTLHDAVDGSSASGRKRKSGPGTGRAATQPAARPKTRRTPRGRSEVPTTRRVVEKQWTAEDGFMWRNYGHKVIMNRRYPRLYFRCSYKQESGCPATRQVQQCEDDPSLYVITYFGQHTCCLAAAPMAADNLDTQPPFAVIDIGSNTSSSGDAEPRLPEGGDRRKNKELGLQAKESHTQPAHASCSSSAWDPCSSDYLGDTLCDYVTQLFSFDDDNARLYCH